MADLKQTRRPTICDRQSSITVNLVTRCAILTSVSSISTDRRVLFAPDFLHARPTVVIDRFPVLKWRILNKQEGRQSATVVGRGKFNYDVVLYLLKLYLRTGESYSHRISCMLD